MLKTGSPALSHDEVEKPVHGPILSAAAARCPVHPQPNPKSHHGTSSSATKSKTKSLRTRKRSIPSMLYARPWSEASQFEKLAAAYEELHFHGGRVFTLRLSEDALFQVTGSADPVRTMSRRLQKAFRGLGLEVPMLAFCLEVTRDEREELHLHGAILVGNVDLKVMRKALRVAGGRMPGRAAPRQAQVRPFNVQRGGPEGWMRYVLPTATLTKRVIEHHRLTYMTTRLRRKARDRWQRLYLSRPSKEPRACVSKLPVLRPC